MESKSIFILNENNHRHRIKSESEKLSRFYYYSRIEQQQQQLTLTKNIVSIGADASEKMINLLNLFFLITTAQQPFFPSAYSHTQ